MADERTPREHDGCHDGRPDEVSPVGAGEYRESGPYEPAPPPARRGSGGLVGLGIAMLVAVAGLLGLWWWTQQQEEALVPPAAEESIEEIEVEPVQPGEPIEPEPDEPEPDEPNAVPPLLEPFMPQPEQPGEPEPGPGPR